MKWIKRIQLIFEYGGISKVDLGMKILVANKMDWNHPRSGGVEVNLKETLGRLAERGHEVHLLTSLYPGAESSEMLDGVQVHRYGIPGRTNEIFILTVGQLLLNYWIKKIDPDVVYTVFSIMTWIPIFGRDKHLVSIHHLNKKSSFGQFNFPFNILSYITEKISMRIVKNKKIMAVSPSTSKDLVDHGINKENITEVLNGINYEDYQRGENSDKPTILYLGRLEYNKGADLIPDLYQYLEENNELQLEIAGRGRKEEQIREFAEDRERVNFHSYVSKEKKQKLMQKAWVVVTPSRREGWGLTVAESNASGTPVVGFSNSGLKCSIKDDETGILVSSNPHPRSHLEEFANAVTELIENDSKRQKLARNATEFAKKRSWDETVDELEVLLEENSDIGE